MKKNILITGQPRSGKTTLMRKLISDIPNKVGFVTNEMLDNGKRVGFEVETNGGKKVILSHIDLESPNKVSRYFVKSENLDLIISEVENFDDGVLLYLDEIGQMQLYSNKFKGLARKYLDSKNTCVAVVSQIFENDFIRNLKKRDDVIVVEINPENREEKEIFLNGLIKKIEKARNYITTPDLFVQNDDSVVLTAKHGQRNLHLTNGQWVCDCDFFKQYKICSHSIATEEIKK